jgi:hypothetical protein
MLTVLTPQTASKTFQGRPKDNFVLKKKISDKNVGNFS